MELNRDCLEKMQQKLIENLSVAYAYSDFKYGVKKFKVWEFDHDTQTDHKLKGAHKGIDCLAFQRDVVKKTEDNKLAKD